MYICSNCGGNLKFNISTQMLGCEYCDTQVDPYSFEENQTTTTQTDTSQNTEFEATIFTCPQCGGEILSTDTSAAEFCSFCGASTILHSRIRKEKRPTYIIPFKKTKEDCKNAYSQLMKHAPFVPNEFKDPKRIDGFRGIYMPYWAFHMTQNEPFSFKGSKTYRHGDFIYTDHYALQGEIDAYYRGLSYDASSSFDDNISEKIAPYDIREMKPFTPAFLSGFYGDIADVSSEVYRNEAEQIATENSIDAIYKTNAFSGFSMEGLTTNDSFIHTKTQKADSAMFPVWFMSYRNGDRVAYATINGQTGKIVTDLPIDMAKYIKGSLLLAIPIFILLNLFFTVIPQTLTMITIGITLLAIILYQMEISNIIKKENGELDKGQQTKQQMRSNAERKQKAFPNGKKQGGFLACIICIILSILIIVWNPASDLFYYGVVIASLLAVVITFKDIMYYYNILATRKLPQFNRTGGDDRA